MTINVSLFLDLRGEVVALKSGLYGERVVLDATTLHPPRMYILADLGGTAIVDGSRPLTVYVYKEVRQERRCPTCNQVIKETDDGRHEGG